MTIVPINTERLGGNDSPLAKLAQMQAYLDSACMPFTSVSATHAQDCGGSAETKGKNENKPILLYPFKCLRPTRPPENSIVEKGELHLCVMLKRSPTSRRCHVNIGHIEWDVDC